MKNLFEIKEKNAAHRSVTEKNVYNNLIDVVEFHNRMYRLIILLLYLKLIMPIVKRKSFMYELTLKLYVFLDRNFYLGRLLRLLIANMIVAESISASSEVHSLPTNVCR